MTNDITGLVALIGAITALVTAIGTLILHLRSQSNAKPKASAEQSSSTQNNDIHAENTPYTPPTGI